MDVAGTRLRVDEAHQGIPSRWPSANAWRTLGSSNGARVVSKPK